MKSPFSQFFRGIRVCPVVCVRVVREGWSGEFVNDGVSLKSKKVKTFIYFVKAMNNDDYYKCISLSFQDAFLFRETFTP